MRLSLIAAVAENGVIGFEGQLPWRLREDLRRFKAITLGKPVIMGRKTWDSIGRPLPGRLNLVCSRQPETVLGADQVVTDLVQALVMAAGTGAGEAFIIGGAGLYREALPRADRCYLTLVHACPEGDVFFPELHAADWHETVYASYPRDTANAYATTFRILDRRRAAASGLGLGPVGNGRAHEVPEQRMGDQGP